MKQRTVKLSVRIISGFAGLMVLLLIMALVTIMNMVKVNSEVLKISGFHNRQNLLSSMEKSVISATKGLQGVLAGVDIEENKQDMTQGYQEFQSSFEEAEKTFVTEQGKKLLEQIKESAGKVWPLMNQALELSLNIDNPEVKDFLTNQVTPTTKELIGYLHETFSLGERNIQLEMSIAQQVYSNSLTFLIILFCIFMASGIFLAYYITRSITKSMNSITSRIRVGAQQVAAASGQLSASAGQLSQGSTEQAAAIEETSSTLEESASMMEQNLTNTKQVAQLSEHAKVAADKGNHEMQEMMNSIQEIKKSSDQIAKIIKVIDDIAFQTNILALNAAIEAARAGEAGMGFAVVAEEVRNLAGRSAQAAKDTTAIIESNIELSTKGVSIAEKVREALNEITIQSKKVNELMDEIAAASQEQSLGIEQVNKSIAQVTVVTQQNAANAEESASAAEELNAQSENMKQIVQELSMLVYGTVTAINQIGYQGQRIPNLEQLQGRPKTNPSEIHLEYSNSQKLVTDKTNLKTKVISPEDVIPLEDDARHF